MEVVRAFLGRERRPDMHNSFAKLDAMTPVLTRTNLDEKCKAKEGNMARRSPFDSPNHSTEYKQQIQPDRMQKEMQVKRPDLRFCQTPKDQKRQETRVGRVHLQLSSPYPISPCREHLTIGEHST